MSLSYDPQPSCDSHKPRSGYPSDGPTAGGHIVQLSMSLLVKIKQLKRRPMHSKSSRDSNITSLHEKAPTSINKSPLCSVQSLHEADHEVASTDVNSSEIYDQMIEALSTTITSKRAHAALNTSAGVPSSSEYARFMHSDLHKGKLNTFVERLDRRQIEKELSGLETYDQFRKTAEHLGHLCHFENWKNNERPVSCDFDVVQLKARLHDVEKARLSRNPEQMLQLIRTQLSRFNSDIDKGTLFHPFLHGTKKIIEAYTESVCGLFEDVTRLCARYGNDFDRLRLAIQLQEVKNSFGETALLCSGGGTYGMRHIGTIKCLFEAGILPHIITGASAGAIVCAVLGSKTEDQLQQVLETFCHGDLKVFIGDHEPPGWWFRICYVCRNWHLFDAKNLARVMRFHLGDMTFSEAYRLTGRILNITVSSGKPDQSINVLNFETAGNVMLWSAVVASCALPGTYEGCHILMKHPETGEFELWSDSTAHVDGSIHGDIPFAALRTQFNVNHAVVAQVNPHVVPFVEDKCAEDRRRHPTLVAFLDCLKEEAAAFIMPFFPRFSSIVSQKYSGDITILPKDWVDDLTKVLSNPTPHFMESAKGKGEHATWERMSIIENHTKIEKALGAATKAAWEAVEQQVHI